MKREIIGGGSVRFVIGRVTVSALAAGVLAGCGADVRRAGNWAGTVDTLASGAIRVHSPAAGVWDSATAWRLTEDLRIGAVEGGGPEVFGRVRVFGPDGRHVRTFGREGAGPGEFGNPTGLVRASRSRLWVVDPAHGRYTVFDTTGSYIESLRRSIAGWSFAWAGGFDDAGRLHERSSVLRPPGQRTRRDRHRPVLVRFAVDSAVVPLDTVPLPTSDDDPLFEFTYTRNGRRMTTFAAVPFAGRLEWRFDRRGYVWFGTSDRYRLIQRTLAGDTVRIVEREYTPLPVTEEDRRGATERFDRYVRMGARPEWSRIPDTRPVFRSFRIDSEGFLWVRLVTDDAGTAYDVFDRDGRYLGRVVAALPLATMPRPLIRPDAFYGVLENELDVPFVVQLRLDRR